MLKILISAKRLEAAKNFGSCQADSNLEFTFEPSRLLPLQHQHLLTININIISSNKSNMKVNSAKKAKYSSLPLAMLEDA